MACSGPRLTTLSHPQALALARFFEDYPDYKNTAAIDDLRASEYGRLETAETYVDYMGGSLFPAAVIVEHGKMLLKSGDLFGNAHSRSERCAHRLIRWSDLSPNSSMTLIRALLPQLSSIFSTGLRVPPSRPQVL